MASSPVQRPCAKIPNGYKRPPKRYWIIDHQASPASVQRAATPSNSPHRSQCKTRQLNRPPNQAQDTSTNPSAWSRSTRTGLLRRTTQQHRNVQQFKYLEQPVFAPRTNKAIYKEDPFYPSKSVPTTRSQKNLQPKNIHPEQRDPKLKQLQSTSDHLGEDVHTALITNQLIDYHSPNRSAPFHPRGRKRNQSGLLDQDLHGEPTAAERSRSHSPLRTSSCPEKPSLKSLNRARHQSQMRKEGVLDITRS
ncbi:MAG: hypothetical protein Q9196_005508 [Gyalolechia fulgens]